MSAWASWCEHAPVAECSASSRLEFDAPLQLFRSCFVEDERVATHLLAACESLWFEQRFRQWDCTADQLPALERLMKLFKGHERPEVARQLARFGLSIDQEQPYLLTEQLLTAAMKERTDSNAFVGTTTFEVLSAASMEHANTLGVRLWQAERYAQAAAVFEAVVAEFPCSSTAWTNLAINYEALGDFERAAAAFERAGACDPANSFWADSVVRFRQRALEQASSARGITAALSSDSRRSADSNRSDHEDVPAGL